MQRVEAVAPMSVNRDHAMDDMPADPRQAAVLCDLLMACPWMTAILDEVRVVGRHAGVTC
jgi:hypothetical protein